ncbi:hypothetical protein GCM10027299_00290 [Larkinella ripae]
MSIQPRIPRKPQKSWLSSQSVTNNRTYFALAIILFMLETVNPKHTFLYKLSMLFKKYPDVDKNAMGFEIGWENEELWRGMQTYL